MRLTVQGILIAEIESVYHAQGPRSEISDLVKAGTHCPVLGVPKGEDGIRTLVNAALKLTAEVSTISREFNHDSVDRGALIVVPEIVDATSTSVRSAFELPRAGEALCTLVGDKVARFPPLAIICGTTLPALGRVPPCSLVDLQATWARIAWRVVIDGRFLHEQPSAEWEQALERKLTERLRELYGE